MMAGCVLTVGAAGFGTIPAGVYRENIYVFKVTNSVSCNTGLLNSDNKNIEL